MTDQTQEDMIRARAHQIWEAEGCPEGREAEHWAQAIEELSRDAQASEPPAQGTPDYGHPTDRAQEEGHAPASTAGTEPHRREGRKAKA